MVSILLAHLFSPSLSLSLWLFYDINSDEASCFIVSFSTERPTWQGTWWEVLTNSQWGSGFSSQRVIGELVPTKNQVSRCGSKSFPSQFFRWDHSSSHYPDSVLWGIPKQRTYLAKLCLDWWPTDHKIINICCFKLLNFEVIYHTAIDN